MNNYSNSICRMMMTLFAPIFALQLAHLTSHMHLQRPTNHALSTSDPLDPTCRDHSTTCWIQRIRSAQCMIGGPLKVHVGSQVCQLQGKYWGKQCHHHPANRIGVVIHLCTINLRIDYNQRGQRIWYMFT